MLPLDTCVELNEKIMVICDSTKPQNEIFFLETKRKIQEFHQYSHVSFACLKPTEERMRGQDCIFNEKGKISYMFMGTCTGPTKAN